MVILCTARRVGPYIEQLATHYGKEKKNIYYPKKIGRGENDRSPGIILRRDRNIDPGRENLRTRAPITNGSVSTVHSATVQPEGGAQDIVTQERMGHNEEIILTKPENSP